MKLTYKVTRAKAPIFKLSDPPTPEVIAANAEAIAEWLKGIHQQRVEIARMGGLATKGICTPRKRRSSIENGKKGGRPRKGKKWNNR
jgi:hypothetical protein